ncbi:MULTISPECIES: hypothetical protein [Streptomyces]|uniref:hypothetical protein n=1 Tax=Streptomyces TaxID=1883 RepID=UPI00142EF337|nr:hypothetical protein [Streptomyces tendae]
MTDSAGPGPDTRREAGLPRRMIVRVVLRIVGSTTALLTLYYLLPLATPRPGSPSRCW